MNFDFQILPLYNFFNRLRSHKGFELGLEEYICFIEILQKDLSYFESPKRLFDLCFHLWFKPGQSEILFSSLFKKSIEEFEIDIDKQDFDEDKEEVLKKNQENEVTPDKESEKAVKEVETRENLQELYLNIIQKREGKEAKAIQEEDLMIKYNFRFRDFYPGVNFRQFKQQWRFLRNPYYSYLSNEFDLVGTINEAAMQGFIKEFKYKKKKKDRNQLLFLIDHQGSMVAFKKLRELILNSAFDALGLYHQVYYFNNLPLRFKDESNWGYYVYDDISQTNYKDLLQILKNNNFKHNELSIIVFSDAGSGKGSINLKRIDATIDFITEIKNSSSKIVWLNPVPEDRWKDTSASIIREKVIMIHADDKGMKKAVDFLRGKLMFKREIH